MKIIYSKIMALLAITFILGACSGDDDNDTHVVEQKSIVDVATENGSFTTLITALQTTGLDETLADLDATFTVFAPTDAAFALLGEDAINALLADSDALSDILLYHLILASEVDSSAAIAAAGSKIDMANGDQASLSLTGDLLNINLSKVTIADVMADNGVIHIIDAVLLPPAEAGEPTLNIVETAIEDGRFTTLVAALGAADLATALANPDADFTVFAPTDDAFDALGQGTTNALLANIPELTTILQKHVISGAQVDALTAMTLNGSEATTLGGDSVDIAIVDGQLTVGGTNVIITDIYTTNGIIHVIDAVIAEPGDLPPLSLIDVATNAGSFSTLLAALDAADLNDTIANLDASFTVFAPTDEAFAALLSILEIDAETLLTNPDLSDILLYHVLSGEVNSGAAIAAAGTAVPTLNTDAIGISLNGETLNVNTATVTTADVAAANGIIHIVDQVLLPPAEAPDMPTANIVETAVAAGNFTTLVTALQAASLDSVLADEMGEFTVFAPTDAAFDLLGSEAIAGLLADIPSLTDILELHVISGLSVDSVSAFTLTGTSVETVGGEMISIAINDGELLIGGSVISTYDLYTSNGIIHVIDTVITQ
ncbi:MAG: transforming growth factor-beta-induced protein [Lentisphaeria bacterium]